MKAQTTFAAVALTLLLNSPGSMTYAASAESAAPDQEALARVRAALHIFSDNSAFQGADPSTGKKCFLAVLQGGSAPQSFLEIQFWGGSASDGVMGHFSVAGNPQHAGFLGEH